MKAIFTYTITICMFLLCGCTNSTVQESAKNSEKMNKQNPILTITDLPYGVPDFSAISDDDFMPAFKKAMKMHLEQIEDIVSNPAEPTIENTLIAMEKAGRKLDRVNRIFGLLSSANTNDKLKSIQEKIAPMRAAHYDKIILNDTLFQRIHMLYEKRDQLNIDDETARLLEVQHRNFVLDGAQLSETDKKKLKKLNEEEASLSAQFSNRLLEATKQAALIVDSAEELKGMSESAIQSAAEKAAEAGHEDKYLLSLQNTTQQPLFQSLDKRETREALFNASWTRAIQGDSTDTRKIVKRLAEIRAEQAALLGFDNYAEWNLRDQMAKKPKAVQDFFDKLIPPATAKAGREAADIQELINAQGKDFSLEPWDWNYFSEQIRKERYDLNQDKIKPYFELWNVVENGVFYASEKLYGLEFNRRTDIPVYQEDMRVYEVFEADGSSIGLFYCDYFTRDNKSGGAWMDNIVGQSELLETKPVVYNVCNFNKPSDGGPALLTFDEVSTLFHEFGHTLHGLFADQKYPTLSGTNVARDFVEFPSQANEHWALYPEVLENYAFHVETGEKIPQELINKIEKASTFNQGYALTELLAAANLDMQWHTLGTESEVSDVNTFEKKALKRTDLYLDAVPPRYRTTYFLHIWGHGYAAGYYAYLWTEMLSEDTYQWFKENGGLTRENGQRFRDMILSRGNTVEYKKLYRAFRGHEPKIKPMLEARGLTK